MEFKDEAAYPIKASAGGKNSYVLRCEYIEQSAHYAVCLNKHVAHEAGRDAEAIGPACVRAIENEKCPALQMRKQEIAAGQAIFYIDREKFKVWQHEQFMAEGLIAKTGYEPVRQKRRVPLPPIIGDISEQALNIPVPFGGLKSSASKKSLASVETLGDGGSYADAINTALTQALESTPISEGDSVGPTPAVGLSLAAKPGLSLMELARKAVAIKGASNV